MGGFGIGLAFCMGRTSDFALIVGGLPMGRGFFLGVSRSIARHLTAPNSLSENVGVQAVVIAELELSLLKRVTS